MTTNSERTGYFVDPETAEEAERLRTQGRYLDKLMGLLPPGLPDPDSISDYHVLDIGCSSGGWPCAVAERYRSVRSTGIDISTNMIQAAKARAIANKIPNAHFDIHDARTFPLPFADACFQLIHARLIFAFMNVDLWPLFLQECHRLLRPGGHLVLTENDAQCWTTSTALAELYRLGHLALYANRNSWQKECVGIVARLPGLMKGTGFRTLSMVSHRIDIGSGTGGYKIAAKDHRTLYRDLQPFYMRMGVSTQEELDALYQQMVKEIGQADFNAYWFFTRFAAQKPEQEAR